MEFTALQSRTASKCFGWEKSKLFKTLILAFGVVFTGGLMCYEMVKINELNEMLSEQKI